MAQTKLGGLRAKQTEINGFVETLGMSLNEAEEHYRKVRSLRGKKGGKGGTGRNKGFAANRELARLAGKKGGRISRRTYKNGN